MNDGNTYDLRQLQLEQLSVLDELKRVCEENHLTFYLAYGTCLGAVRHKGFIPWDDDIDVLMPVEDYDKLMLLSDKFGEGYFLQNSDTDPGFNLAIARIRKRGTACIEEQELQMDCHHGIFVDIYPQYQYPDNKLQRLEIITASVLYRILLMNRAPANHGAAVKAVGNAVLKMLSLGGRDKKLAQYYNILRRFHHTAFVADLYGMDLTLTRVIKYPSKWFAEPSWREFENRIMPLPTNAEGFLSERYGEDYMELPPEEKRASYHRYAYVSFTAEYRPDQNAGRNNDSN